MASPKSAPINLTLYSALPLPRPERRKIFAGPYSRGRNHHLGSKNCAVLQEPTTEALSNKYGKTLIFRNFARPSDPLSAQKYRDELRPRHGLLRGREFCMKDLYTFDLTTEAALETYEDVRKAYSELFINDMKLPILVAKASSGDMGGSLSHEYHIPTPLGEDHVMSCDSCDYVANEEVAKSREVEAPQTGDLESIKVWRGISKDRVKFINVYYDSAGEVNTHAVKKLVPDLDPGAGDAVPLWTAALTSAERGITMVTIFDRTVPLSTRKGIVSHRYSILPEELSEYQEKVKMPYAMNAKMPQDTSLLRITEGDGCPQCSNGKLTVQKAIELGHTFHLGTRYSEPMNAQVNVPKRLLLEAAAKGRSSSTSSTQTSSEPDAVEGAALPATTGSAPSALAEDCPSNLTTETFMQMGCHGIGISRIIGAVANHLVDERGLNWPRAIAPYEVVIVYDVKDEAVAPDASAVYDALASQPPQSAQQSQIDVVLDDREHARLSWKLQDGDLVGYPVIVVIGKAWKSSRRVEVQCRRLAFRTLVSVEELRSCVGSLLQKL